MVGLGGGGQTMGQKFRQAGQEGEQQGGGKRCRVIHLALLLEGMLSLYTTVGGPDAFGGGVRGLQEETTFKYS